MNFHHALNTPVLDDAYAKVTAGAHTGAYGANDLKTPSEAQAQAGTYKMGRVTVQGLRIAIEQPCGSIRSGKGADGKEWSSRMAAHYGYFEGTRGADGDGIDCFVGPYPESEQVFVINQRNPGGGFDEHKILIGFSSERHARGAYLDSYERGWRGLQSLVPISLDQLRWWIKNGKKSIALTAESLPQQGTNPMNPKITWTEAQPDSISLDQVLYQLRRMDGADGLLLDSVTMAEIMEDTDGVIALDALVVENAQLTRMAERLRAIMDRSGGTVKAPAVQVSEPFRARGVTNIAAVFELSDGQTVSVFFHNPDTAPNKLAPGDEMISWKWLLNKKDITIVVAPEKGQDLNPRLVASRIMKLAEKNSPAFQKANAKRSERMGNIEAIRGRIAEKEATLTELVAQVEAARLEKDQKVELQREANKVTRQEVKNWLEDSGYAVKNAAMSQYTKAIGERVMFVTAAEIFTVALVVDSSKLGGALLNPMSEDFHAALIPASDGATQPAMGYIEGFEAIKGFVEGREREAVTVLPAAATVEYLAIEDASDEQLSFAREGLQGLYAGEMAYFVGNPKNPDMVSSSVGYWRTKDVGSKPTELVYRFGDVDGEQVRRAKQEAQEEPQLVAELYYPPAPDGWTLENSVPGMWVTYSKDGVRGVFYTGEKSPSPGAFMIITPDNKLHSSMHPSDGGGEGSVTWEEAFSRANEVAAEFAPAPTPELKQVTYSGLAYEPSMLTEADSVQAWNDALEGNAGDMAAAAKEVYRARLQGTYVETNKGLVLLSGAGWREMKTKLDADTLRCKAIPFIPHLLRGAEGVEEPLAKTRNDYSGFIKFDGIVTVADGTKIRAVAKVGVRLDGQLMYFLHASEGALDSANDEGGGLPQVKSPLSTPSDDQGLPPAMDAILASEEDDVNLVILEAWDKDGNPLDLLAGSGGEPTLEPAAEPTPEPTVTPEPAPEPAPAPADPKTEDRAFFMSVIDGSNPDILEPELADKLAQAYERHAGDAEITSLFMQAGNAYTQAMLAATEGV